MKRASAIPHLIGVIVIASSFIVLATAALGILAAFGPIDPPLTSTPAVPATAVTTPDVLPAFAEECNGSQLDPKWSALYVAGDPGHGLDSDFLGDVSQVAVADGLCTIRAARQPTPSGRLYASAAVGTRTTFAQAFGTFEARIRYTGGQGVWPAFWMLEAGALSPPPEIDILEAYPGDGGAGGGSGANTVVSALHYDGGTHYFEFKGEADLTAGFHTHRLTWSPNLLVFSIDGVVTGRITRDVPDVAMYPIFNLAVGAPGFRADASSPPVAVMDIDYLRVWRP